MLVVYVYLSPFGQATILTRLQYYLRSTRYSLPKLLQALSKGADPDRMKGALYLLWNKGIGEPNNSLTEDISDIVRNSILCARW